MHVFGRRRTRRVTPERRGSGMTPVSLPRLHRPSSTPRGAAQRTNTQDGANGHRCVYVQQSQRVSYEDMKDVFMLSASVSNSLTDSSKGRAPREEEHGTFRGPSAQRGCFYLLFFGKFLLIWHKWNKSGRFGALAEHSKTLDQLREAGSDTPISKQTL